MKNGVADPLAEVSVYHHCNEMPIDTRQLFENAERKHVELGISWFDNLANTVYTKNDDIRFYVLRIGGTPVAALPIVVTSHALGTRVQSLSNFYTAIYDLPLAPDVTSLDLLQIIAAIKRDCRNLTSFKLAPMDPQAPSFQVVQHALKLAGLVPFDYFCFGNWYQRHIDNWPNYLKSRSGILRSTIKRQGKKFTADGGRLEIIEGTSELERAVSAFNTVYTSSWKNPEPYPEFVPGLIRMCAARGWLRLGVAWLNDKPVAAQLWIVAGGKANIYKLAYDEAYKAYAPGTLLTAVLMQYAIEKDKVIEIDYLIGDDPYKKSWMSDRRERWGLIAYNPRTLSGLAELGREHASRLYKRVRKQLAKHPAGQTDW